MTDVTHEVFNQPEPLVGYNLFETNRALRDALKFNAPGLDTAPLQALGALAGTRGQLRLVDLERGRTEPFRGGHDGRIYRMRFSPDGRTLVTTAADGGVIAWDVERRVIAHRFVGHSTEVISSP